VLLVAPHVLRAVLIDSWKEAAIYAAPNCVNYVRSTLTHVAVRRSVFNGHFTLLTNASSFVASAGVNRTRRTPFCGRWPIFFRRQPSAFLFEMILCPVFLYIVYSKSLQQLNLTEAQLRLTLSYTTTNMADEATRVC